MVKVCKNIKGIWLLLVAIFSVSNLLAQNSSLLLKDNVAFAAGEKLVYAVSYKVGLLNVDVASVGFSTTNAKVNGVETYHVRAIGEVNPSYTWFYNLHDVYDTWLDKTNLKPLFFSNNLREGDYRYTSSYLYDWDSLKVTTKARNLKNPETTTKVFPLSVNSYDAIALFFNIRSTDMGSLKKNVEYPIEVVFANQIRHLSFRFIGKVEKNIKELGKFDALEYRCSLADESGVAFEDGSEFSIFISDDKNRIPLYVESPIKVGSVRVRLISYEGLKYPIRSK